MHRRPSISSYGELNEYGYNPDKESLKADQYGATFWTEVYLVI
jgi:hypothetical protein